MGMGRARPIPEHLKGTSRGLRRGRGTLSYADRTQQREEAERSRGGLDARCWIWTPSPTSEREYSHGLR
jgi:hypothetical protein